MVYFLKYDKKDLKCVPLEKRSYVDAKFVDNMFNEEAVNKYMEQLNRLLSVEVSISGKTMIADHNFIFMYC